jgi:hypothetical protein
LFTFALKAEFKRQPYLGAGVLASFIVILSGILMRVFERSVSDSFSYAWNGLWLIGITISTVGYGDIVPLTHIGRFICTVSAISGLYALSYAVNSVQGSFVISNSSEQSIATALAYRMKLTHNTKRMASTLIQRWWRLSLKRKADLPRLTEVQHFTVFLLIFKGFRTKTLKVKDPNLQDTATSIENHSTREITKLLRHLRSLGDSKSQVKD